MKQLKNEKYGNMTIHFSENNGAVRAWYDNYTITFGKTKKQAFDKMKRILDKRQRMFERDLRKGNVYGDRYMLDPKAAK